MADKFIRFITFQTETVTGLYLGFFKAAYALRRNQIANEADSGELDELLCWFDKHLEAPTRLSKSRKYNAHAKALSWFKPTAVDHIKNSRKLLELLRDMGLKAKCA